MALPKRALGAALASAAALATPIAQPAMAEDARTQQVALQDIRLPMKDARGAEARAVQMSAAMVSKGKQVLVFYGDDARAFEETKRGAREAIAAGVPLAGMIVASPLDPRSVGEYHIAGSNQVEFYADGQRTGTIDNVDKEPHRVANMVRTELQRGFDIIQSRRQLALAP